LTDWGGELPKTGLAGLATQKDHVKAIGISVSFLEIQKEGKRMKG